jgi:hypothetical protein
MCERITTRLGELEAELAKGRQVEAELVLRLEAVRRDLLRVSGAAQVLGELLRSGDGDATDSPPLAATRS